MSPWIPCALLVTVLALQSDLSAQVHIDRPIRLEGSDAANRQVVGLRDGDGESDALNAGTLRAAPYRYAEVAGTTQWDVTLTPTVSEAHEGLCLLLLSNDGNSGPVIIGLSSAGSFPLLKGPGLPLQAGDVLPGELVSAVFDGTTFQLIAARRQDIRPCPSGSVAVNEQYCIEIAQHDTAEFDVASIACGQQNGRMCTWSEWWVACNKLSTLGLQDMVGDWEWTNNAANADGYVRVVGQSSCTQAATSVGWGGLQRSFRCCYRR
ncbi:MAG: hypothetical protein JST66_05000 [Bacteroidetes bacterium]|nr:hypothetical protein [Bacteroidota bacterium]